MGIIAAATPGGKSNKTIPRLKISIADLNKIGKINIRFYSPTKSSDMRWDNIRTSQYDGRYSEHRYPLEDDMVIER